MSNKKPMYIVYMDDSRQDNKIQIIAAVILKDTQFEFLEQQFGYTIAEIVPEEYRLDFEFHSCDLLNGNKPFKGITRVKAIEILGEGVKAISSQVPCVVYGAVDLNRLHGSLYASAEPIDIAFRLCALAVEDWFVQYAPNDLGVFISDDTANQQVKKAIRKAFQQFRCKVRTSPISRGRLAHSLDDIYFGSSQDSFGIQLADICSLLIRRHLVGFSDTEDLYQSLSPQIFKGATEPPSMSVAL